MNDSKTLETTRINRNTSGLLCIMTVRSIFHLPYPHPSLLIWLICYTLKYIKKLSCVYIVIYKSFLFLQIKSRYFILSDDNGSNNKVKSVDQGIVNSKTFSVAPYQLGHFLSITILCNHFNPFSLSVAYM